MNLTLVLIKHCFEIPEAIELLDEAINSSISILDFNFDYYLEKLLRIFIDNNRFDVFEGYENGVIGYLIQYDVELAIKTVNYFNMDINDYIVEMIEYDIEFGILNHELIKPYINDDHIEEIKKLTYKSIENDFTYWLYLMDTAKETLIKNLSAFYIFPRKCISYYGESLTDYLDELSEVCVNLGDSGIQFIYAVIGYNDKLLYKLSQDRKKIILKNTKEDREKYIISKTTKSARS